jgi:hypothetical protein
MTARATLSSSRSISSSPKVLVSGCPPELADPLGTLEVGQHEDVVQFGAGSGAEGVRSPRPFPGSFRRTPTAGPAG